MLSPHGVDQLVARDHFIRVEKQEGE
jgi:hypothetical protein